MPRYIDLIEEHGESNATAVNTLISDLAGTPGRVQLEEFTLFRKLPIELRFMIFEEALPSPRFVEIRTTDNVTRSGEYDWEGMTWRPLCLGKAPLLYFVCQEARSVVTKKYEPFRGTQNCSEVILCDFNQDYVCFSYPRCMLCLGAFRSRISDEYWGKIKRIAIVKEFLDVGLTCRHALDLGKMQLDEILIALVSDGGIPKGIRGITGFEDSFEGDEDQDPDQDVRQEIDATFIQPAIKKYPEWNPPTLRFGRFTVSE